MSSFSHSVKDQLVPREQALPGHDDPLPLPSTHAIFGNAVDLEPGPGQALAVFGMGCFWGAERKYWQREGVVSTAVGYAGGYSKHPRYREVCSGLTGHAEVVRVVFDFTRVSYDELLMLFWQVHDPTQGMRQGNDRGSQYRSVILATNPQQRELALASRERYAAALREAHGPDAPAITTEITELAEFFFAEPDHQQYLAHNPNGYCGLRGTGVACPAPS